ncbi:hypothetical protein RQCS_01620 [Rhodococcus qingshengii]|nr:hypothetical protein RE2895_01850 [Rhodococcus erythropolis]BCF80617.1 hypothetical protein RQCS_01620 [Rhodococcus qingshengii]
MGTLPRRRHFLDELTDIVDQLSHDVRTEFGQQRLSVTRQVDGDDAAVRRQLVQKRIPRLPSMDDAMDEHKRGTTTGDVMRQGHVTNINRNFA